MSGIYMLIQARRAMAEQIERERARSHLLLDREQILAREHVLDAIEEHGSHDVNACPPNTRAICSYARVIETMRPEDFE